MMQWMSERSITATGWTRADVDLEDPGSVALAMAAIKPDIVFHLAAIPAKASDNDWRLIRREVIMLDALAAALPRNGVLVYCGSMAEIGYSGVHDEEVFCRPNTLYGMAKSAASNRALALANASRQIRVARLFGVCGPGEAPQRLIPTVVSQLVRSKPVELSDGEQIRDFVHVSDVCKALWALATTQNNNPPPLTNVGTGSGVKVRDLCCSVAKILNCDPQLLKFGAIPRRHVDEEELVADVALLQRITGLTLPQHVREFGAHGLRMSHPIHPFVDYVKELANS